MNNLILGVLYVAVIETVIKGAALFCVLVGAWAIGYALRLALKPDR